ncbi:MAG: hypothetical protein HY584_05540 [Candidatus Omnitrophica bacterium]|nr:hypothetical protein [Candidatus Omnitrophota bacterium]
MNVIARSEATPLERAPVGRLVLPYGRYGEAISSLEIASLPTVARNDGQKSAELN